jgi:hypothetical protein
MIQTIQQECHDHFLMLGEWHLNHIVRERVEHNPHRAAAFGVRAPAAGRNRTTSGGWDRADRVNREPDTAW